MTHERTIPLVVRLEGDGEATCILCGRTLLHTSRCAPSEIHVVDGGAAIAHPDYEWPWPESDVGWHSIGPECARMFPPGWALKPVEAYQARKRLTSR